jgi:hypothetical protein
MTDLMDAPVGAASPEFEHPFENYGYDGMISPGDNSRRSVIVTTAVVLLITALVAGFVFAVINLSQSAGAAGSCGGG